MPFEETDIGSDEIQEDIRNTLNSLKGPLSKSLDEDEDKILNTHRAAVLAVLLLLRNRVLRKANKISNEAISEAILTSNKSLKAAGLPVKKFSEAEKKAITSLNDVSVRDINRAFDSYADSVSAYYSRLKSASAERTALKSVLSPEAFRSRYGKELAIKRFERSLRDNLIDGHILAGKRRIPLDVYSKTTVNTVVSAVANRVVEVKTLRSGLSHIIISSHNGIYFCRAYEGKVFSLVPNDPSGYPHISRIPNGGPPFHPNCKHFSIPHKPDEDFEDNPDGAATDSSLTRDTKAVQKAYPTKKKK